MAPDLQPEIDPLCFAKGIIAGSFNGAGWITEYCKQAMLAEHILKVTELDLAKTIPLQHPTVQREDEERLKILCHKGSE